MKFVAASTGLLMLCLLAGAAGAQDAVYKWMGEDGIPHYSDQPPMTSQAEELPIRYRRTDRSMVRAKTQERRELTATEGEQKADEAANAATEEATRDKVLSERDEFCRKAKERAANYENARRLYKPGRDGERIYLTDEELDAERAAARQGVDEWCN